MSDEVTTTPAVDSALSQTRSAAGTKGARRTHELAQRGRLYEQEHHLTPGRQRHRQLVEMGRLYEKEHGLAPPRRVKRQRKADAWKEFVAALSRVVKAAHRPAVLQLLAALEPPPKPAA